mmetsp:Transcript_13673/g.41307  ORF Transcript_13673/g.41307 Transcript_13673/m.41307 type:complete len:433 (+) Transcript_13673:278-1576(+)|eukprot:CAMPEP_0206137542 /NCGR_PEP_ID=MMETSP1473-20131121/2648_1 /ASSEMBLY_ACC=CAM_ASM_001109 /TAXON_ID=1461547 /ORGANISM="Stichococcus sp, Strain RCC1054" /LENGTH=432 /DNA_ID=CAMNT_0053530681 /DNA_START=266 /DNA_END=1564 /DNA_ORIENTATION=-
MADPVMGAATVFGAIVAFGSFGVPIKSRRLQDAQVHPLVVQGYKSTACFATCWLALFVAKLNFTWWGIVGASIWVVNGVAAVVAIQAAGLAVSQALWSGLSVFVSFIWGAVLFHEPIANRLLALAGLVLMAAGMAVIGVVTGNAHVLPNALLGSPGSKAKRSPQSIVHLEPGTSDGQRGSVGSADSMLVDEESAQVLARANNIPSPAVRSIGLLERSLAHSARAMSCLAADGEPHPVIAALPQHSPDSPATALLVSDETADWEAGQRQGQRQGHRHWPGYRAGIGCAVFIGISNGSFLVPLKYANQTVTGMEYLVSFGIGAAAATAAAAAMHFAVSHYYRWQRLRLKVRQAGPPALLAGLLWSAGNFFSIIATQKLGMAVAWPAVQVQLLVSTVWGAVWYREIRSTRAGAALLGASASVVAGVVCLARAKGL